MAASKANLEFITTADGSVTLFNPETEELYHNSAGAYTEALKSYVEPSQAAEILERNGSLQVLDACFGLGYNSFVLVEQILKMGARGDVLIKAVENDPAVVQAAWTQVLRTDTRLQAVRAMLRNSTTTTPQIFAEGECDGLRVVLQVVLADLRTFVQTIGGEIADVDLIFHDPFSPRKVPQLWTVDIFRKYHALLNGRRGRLLTYSIAGAVRGGLMEAGFEIWRTTAVGGKYGGTLAMFAGDEPPPGCEAGAAGFGERKGGPRSLVPFRDPDFIMTKNELILRRTAEQAECES